MTIGINHPLCKVSNRGEGIMVCCGILLLKFSTLVKDIRVAQQHSTSLRVWYC